MRIARHGSRGAERPVVAGADRVWRDLTPVVDDVTPATLARVLALGPDDVAALPEAGEPTRVGPPLARPGKVVCIGVNYRAHAAETSLDEPTEPVIFLKTAQTVVGPDDTVLVPRGSTKTDWEVELAVVIGREARYLASPADARACVAGYTISNDVSERELQLERGGTWDKGKNCETFNPLGPWIRTADEVADPQGLGLRLWVNGVARQDSSTAAMIFGVDHLVWYLSQVMVLEPGDVVNTGTPAGVALGLPDHPYLRPGDVVELEIDGLGRQRQTMGAA